VADLNQLAGGGPETESQLIDLEPRAPAGPHVCGTRSGIPAWVQNTACLRVSHGTRKRRDRAVLHHEPLPFSVRVPMPPPPSHIQAVGGTRPVAGLRLAGNVTRVAPTLIGAAIGGDARSHPLPVGVSCSPA